MTLSCGVLVSSPSSSREQERLLTPFKVARSASASTWAADPSLLACPWPLSIPYKGCAPAPAMVYPLVRVPHLELIRPIPTVTCYAKPPKRRSSSVEEASADKRPRAAPDASRASCAPPQRIDAAVRALRLEDEPVRRNSMPYIHITAASESPADMFWTAAAAKRKVR